MEATLLLMARVPYLKVDPESIPHYEPRPGLTARGPRQ